MLRRVIIAILFLLLLPTLHSQELNCKVTINTDKIQTTTTSLFNTLKQAITEYMNDRKWSSAQIAVNEKIECAIFITVNSVSEQDARYSCDIQIQASRPVYNSSYTTTTFNFKDKEFEFNYREYEPLIFNENTFESNLTSVLDFYAYMIIGLDFDTFSYKGGDSFFKAAEKVVAMGQGSQEGGWKAFDSNRNRSAVITDFTEERMSTFRDMWYKYHRLGLDEMAVSPDKGRKVITESLKSVKDIYNTNSMSVLLPIFSDSKLDELVNIYSEAPQSEREEIYKMLYDIYPTEGQRLQKLRNGKQN
ncbi:MAG: DUF4835 family protein [Bacteroidales bacterium]